MSAPVVELARAKVNLALHITGRRRDGYHELDSIVAFAGLGDKLTFHPAVGSEISIIYEGPFGKMLRQAGNDIVLKAASFLQQYCKQAKPGVRITLEKNLPLSSGIGGGSADAAAAMRGLIRLWAIDMPESERLALALKLGADVPVCLRSAPMRMTGIGDRLEPLPTFRPLEALLVNPGVPIATPAVFDALGLAWDSQGFAPIADRHELNLCRNDLERPAMKLVPEIASVLGQLRSQPGITLARMSGSGATCFGLFEDKAATETAAQRIKTSGPSWWIAATTLS